MKKILFFSIIITIICFNVIYGFSNNINIRNEIESDILDKMKGDMEKNNYLFCSLTYKCLRN